MYPSLVALTVLTVGLGALGARAQAQGPPGGQGGQRTPPRAMRAGDEAPRGTAVLRGAIVAADTGAPIRRAQVRVSSPEAQDTRITTTDEQGRFELTELVGGRYTVSASKGGFVSLTYGQLRPSERGTPVDLPAGQTLEKLVIALPRGSVIAGRIVDEFGEPLTGAQVQVLRYGYAAGARRLLPSGQSDRTDDQGAFRIFGLPPGEYFVTASLRENRGPRRDLDADASSSGYAPTYYPGTTNAADAQRVSVGLGQEVSGIGFGLSLMRLARVSGRVIGPAGTEAGGMVTAQPDDTVRVAMGNLRGSPVRGDGTFELTGVPPGQYTLEVRPAGRRADASLAGRTSVTVSGVDLEGVSIALMPTAVAAGRIEADAGGPPRVRAAQVRVSAAPVDSTARGFGGNGQANVADDYTFELRGVSRPSYLRVTAPSGWSLKSILLGGQDVTDAPLAFDPGTAVSGLRVVLTQTTTALAGTVRDDRGNAVLDATVLVFVDDETQWRFQSRFIRTARPDTSGRYEITGLPASADYRVLAVQGMEEGQATDPEFLASLRDRAERLSLNDGEIKTLDVRLRP
jgi:hypothetical protein